MFDHCRICEMLDAHFYGSLERTLQAEILASHCTVEFRWDSCQKDLKMRVQVSILGPRRLLVDEKWAMTRTTDEMNRNLTGLCSSYYVVYALIAS